MARRKVKGSKTDFGIRNRIISIHGKYAVVQGELFEGDKKKEEE